MIDALPDPPDLDPSNLSTSHFTRVRRGFEPTEVNALLGRSADALRTWEERDARLVERLEELERKLAESHELDEERITTVLGEETARIIAVARQAAAEMRATAEAETAALVEEAERTSSARAEALVNESTALRTEAATERDEAREEASLLRQQAIDETVAARAEAEEAADALRSEASAEATRLRDEARAEAERLTSEATRRHDDMLAEAAGVLEERTAAAEAAASAIRETADAELALARDESARIRAEAEAAGSEEVERARSVGRDMVGEARDVRERMLRDLAEKRKKSRQHIEAARAGRARIIESLREANEAVAGIVGELADNDRAVTRAADDAASGVVDDVDLVVAELEATLMSEAALGPLPGDASSDTEDRDSEGADVDEMVGDAGAEHAPVAENDGGWIEPDADPVADAPAGDATADDEPPDAVFDDVIDPVTDAEEVSGAGGPIAEASAPADPASDDDGPGATVHDLFARIRADVDEPVAAEVRTHSVEVSAVASTDGTVTEVVEVTEVTEVVEVADTAGPPADGTAADPAMAALNRRDELLAGPEKALGRLLKRAVSDEQNEVLDSLRRTPKRSRPELDSLLPVDQLNRLSHALRPDFDDAVAAGAEFWTETTHGSATSLLGLADDPGVGEALDGRVSDLLALRSLHLRRSLEEAEAEGLDVTELADRIRSAYRDWRASAVPELAGDLAIAGFAEGVRKAAGPGAAWCWVADNGGLPCSDAEDNSLAGGVTAGDKFPTGDTLPPAHAGCRCILLPAPQ